MGIAAGAFRSQHAKLNPSMIHLHYSNRLENLVAPLASAIVQHQHGRPLEPVSIIVPNRVVEQFVRYRVAESIGIAANLQFPFLRGYLGRMIETADPQIKILEANDLQLVIFECLRDPRIRGDSELEPVRAYIETNSKSDSDLELRTMHLAGHTARLFREYSISRRAMLQQWGRSQRIDSHLLTTTERWQRHLWRSLFDSHRQLLAGWSSDPALRWMMLPDAFSTLSASARRSAVTGTLHVFGQSFMGTAFAEIFAELGKDADIHIYALNPCLEFWEDVPTGLRAARQDWARRGLKLTAGIESAGDPFALQSAADNPALRLWGRPGREHIRLLNQLTECDFDPHFSSPEPSPTETLLESVQKDILSRAPERTEFGKADDPIDDCSIRFLACPGIRREVEIVADEIHSIVCANDSDAGAHRAATLRFHQIAVLVPDPSFDEYVVHIESVFNAHGIPVDIVNRRFAGISRVAEAIDLLMRLPLGRFTRDEMIRLLTHPAIAGDESAEPDTWRLWIEQLGIFFGADREDLQSTYIQGDFYNWDQALKRLTLGAFMAGEKSGVEATFDTPHGPPRLPFEISQDSTAGVSRLLLLARSLIADTLAIRTARMSLSEWSRLLGGLIARYVHPSGLADLRIRDLFLAEIDQIAPPGLGPFEVGFEAACEIVTSRVADLESRSGRLSAAGVAAGSIDSLRSIPFKVIFVLGLGEGRFPSRSPNDPLDLRILKRQAGDVSPTERDRYLFLETLLAARSQIYLSYVAREARTGDSLEPSTLIRELQYILRGYVNQTALDRLTIKHRVSRYDLAYFPTLPEVEIEERQAGLQSFASDARRGARMIALRRSLKRQLGELPIPPCDELLRIIPAELGGLVRNGLRLIEPADPSQARAPSARDEIWLPVSALKNFLECPLQAAARYGLGMFKEDDGEEEAVDEPLEQSRLQQSILLREVFWKSGGDLRAMANIYNEAYLRAQMKGEAPAGLFADTASAADRVILEQWAASATKSGLRDLGDWQDLRAGRGDEFEHADRLLDPIALDVIATSFDGVATPIRVKLYGTLRRISPNLDASLQCVVGNKAGPRHFLPLMLNAIVLAAAGEPVARTFRALVLSGSSDDLFVKEFSPLGHDQARAYLAGLAGSLLSPYNNYYLPLEAVELVVKARKKGDDDPEEAVENLRAHDRGYCSSDSGPIRKNVAHEFDPPPPSTIDKIIRERYEPILEIFAAGKSRR